MFNRLLSRTALATATALTLSLGFVQTATAAVNIDRVTVDNAGNDADTTGYGAVAYDYRISATEVTNAQYTTFLNSVANTDDPYGLYDNRMKNNDRAGITRSGSSGNYTYTTKANMADKPVNYVSWFDAARFANWMTNGQGSGDTESGVYTLTGLTSISGITRDLNNYDQVFLPTEDEWYKAAFHQPFAQGGDTDDYWLYATASNTAPTVATADVAGDISNPGSNVANYDNGAVWNGLTGNVTTVGSAGSGSSSYYGTFDQSGNVTEWTETLNTPERIQRGGQFGSGSGDLQSSGGRFANDPDSEGNRVGFRVASPIPEPASIALVALGAPLLLRRCRE